MKRPTPAAAEGVWFAFTAPSADDADIVARRIEHFARERRHERDGAEAITVLRDELDFYFSPLAVRTFAPLVELYRAVPRPAPGTPRSAARARRFSWRAAKWSSVDD